MSSALVRMRASSCAAAEGPWRRHKETKAHDWKAEGLGESDEARHRADVDDEAAPGCHKVRLG